MIDIALMKIGLTRGETSVYLALLEIGSASTWNITKSSGISGSKVYEVLERLIKKGLVSFVIKNGVKYFEAASPERIIDYLDEKKTEIEEEKIDIQRIIPQLLLKQKNGKKSEAKIFFGFSGLKTANEDILSTLKRGEEWLSMGLSKQPKSWEIYFTKRQETRAQRGIIHKQLINEKYKAIYKIRGGLPNTKFRLLPKELEMPVSTEIYGHKVSFFILDEENPMAIIIENTAVAESFKKYFCALWNRAKIP